MDRRSFLKTAATASVAASLPQAADAAKPSGKRPNILYVFSDQHRAVSLPGEPFNEAHTPNIDAFRRANLSLNTCVSNYPTLRAPSRQFNVRPLPGAVDCRGERYAEVVEGRLPRAQPQDERLRRLFGSGC